MVFEHSDGHRVGVYSRRVVGSIATLVSSAIIREYQP